MDDVYDDDDDDDISAMNIDCVIYHRRHIYLCQFQTGITRYHPVSPGGVAASAAVAAADGFQHFV
jgi:hypothetical protein